MRRLFTLSLVSLVSLVSWLHAEETEGPRVYKRYLLTDFDNGKAVGKNVLDAAPMSDRDEHWNSQSRGFVSPARGDKAYKGDAAIKVKLSIPSNHYLGYEYGGIYFAQDRYDGSSFNALQFAFKSEKGVPWHYPLQVTVSEIDPVYGKVSYKATLKNYAKNTGDWQLITIPFREMLDKRHNRLRGRRIDSVSFMFDGAGEHEFYLDELALVASQDPNSGRGIYEGMRLQAKVIGRLLDDQDFAMGSEPEAYLNIQASPRMGFVEVRASGAMGLEGLVNFSDLTETARTKLHPAFFEYPKGETGLTVVIDGWKKNPLGLRSVSIGNHLIDYSGPTVFKTWFPFALPEENSGLPILGSVSLSGDFYEAFGAFADFDGTDATVGGLKVEKWFGSHFVRGIGYYSDLKARNFWSPVNFDQVYWEGLGTLRYQYGKLKDRYVFQAWGAYMKSGEYYLTRPGDKRRDIDSNRIIRDQKLVSPKRRVDQGLVAQVDINELFIPGNKIILSANNLSEGLRPLYRDYFEGSVDEIFFDSRGVGVNVSQKIWKFNVGAALNTSTQNSNKLFARDLMRANVGWHDIFGLPLSVSAFYQTTHHVRIISADYDEREDQGAWFEVNARLATWVKAQFRFRQDTLKFYDNRDTPRSIADEFSAEQILGEVVIEPWKYARLLLAYGSETPFGHYTYYDPDLVENFFSAKLEATF